MQYRKEIQQYFEHVKNQDCIDMTENLYRDHRQSWLLGGTQDYLTDYLFFSPNSLKLFYGKRPSVLLLVRTQNGTTLME